MSPGSVATSTYAELRGAGEGALLGLLEESLAVRVSGFLDEATCAALTAGVYAGRAVWNRDFGGEQFSLGRAFYVHLEEGRARDYFAGAPASDADVARFVPGLRERMYEAVSLLGPRSRPRPGWCGPGVHVFPAGEKVSREGGVKHFDLEGLTDAHVDAGRPAVTFVAMLQPPATGGGLRVWDVLGGDEATAERRARGSAVVAYQAGDLVLIDSYRLHQIQPFGGKRDRVSATLHAALVADRWETWF